MTGCWRASCFAVLAVGVGGVGLRAHLRAQHRRARARPTVNDTLVGRPSVADAHLLDLRAAPSRPGRRRACSAKASVTSPDDSDTTSAWASSAASRGPLRLERRHHPPPGLGDGRRRRCRPPRPGAAAGAGGGRRCGGRRPAPGAAAAAPSSAVPPAPRPAPADRRGAGAAPGAAARRRARAPPRSRPSSSSSRCSRSPSGTIGSAAHRSSAAISNSRRGVGRRDASSTARAQRSNSTGNSPGAARGREGARLLDLLRRGVDQIGDVDLALAAAHPRDHLEVAQEPQERPPELAEVDAAIGGARDQAQRRARVAVQRGARQLDEQPAIGDAQHVRGHLGGQRLRARRRRSPGRAATARRAPTRPPAARSGAPRPAPP